MRKLQLFFMILVPLYINAQINESFTDGDFTQSPEWTGHAPNFTVNSSFELQSKATSTSVSWLFTASTSFSDAVWQCRIKINYPTSSSNYALFYVISDTDDLTDGCNGYYIQVGGTNDEVSLFLQQGTKRTKIIDGLDKRTDGSMVDIQLKLTRSKTGIFELYSKLVNEQDFVKEGSVINTAISGATYTGLVYSNTSTTGNAYIFDDIHVSGEPANDTQNPEIISALIVSQSVLQLNFSEAVDISKADFQVDNGMGSPKSIALVNRNKTVELTFGMAFSKGILYEVKALRVTDLAGNYPLTESFKTGIPETPESGELVFNEIMFDAPVGGQEYVEFYNLSEKVIDLSKIGFTSRKSNGDLNTLVTIPFGQFAGPNEIFCWALSPDSVLNYHKVTNQSRIIPTQNWYSLNNENATLVLCNQDKDTIYDELTYNSDWHFALLSNTKGISLEKINPLLPVNNPASWHSAASEVNYGTPGYKNSQYRETGEQSGTKNIWCDPESFSPDNDGNNDICFVKYNTEYAGYIANIAVFNPIGVKIADIAKSCLLAADGKISWDGKTSRGMIAEPGVYVLYFEMFHPLTGKKIQEKLPIVVSAR